MENERLADTYAEQELCPLGFQLRSKSDKQVVLSLGWFKLQFDCVCPAYPNIKALGCPLHHHETNDKNGGSWSIEEAKKLVTLVPAAALQPKIPDGNIPC